MSSSNSTGITMTLKVSVKQLIKGGVNYVHLGFFPESPVVFQHFIFPGFVFRSREIQGSK